MSITLTLNNVDSKATSINIYRSVNTPVLAANPGTPYATIPAPASTWTDTDVVNYNVYHYRIEVSDGVNKTISENQMVGYYPDSGPGANVVRRGDWMSGWMDELTPDQFITGTDFIALLTGLGLTGLTGAPANVKSWSKCAYRGKVVLLPSATIGTVSWMNLYNAGLIYGTNDNGVHPPVNNLVETNQRKTVTIKGATYIVRTIRGTTDPTNVALSTAVAQADLTSENNAIRTRLANDGGSPNGQTRFGDYTASTFNTILAQPYSTTAVITGTSNNNFGSTAITTAAQWVPILEFAPGL